MIQRLVDDDYPDRDRIALVMDNLNTYKLSSLCEAFEPLEAKGIAECLEIHYAPKQGSCLDMAEIEIVMLVRQSLDHHNPDMGTLTLRGAVEPYQKTRNRDAVCVNCG